MTDVTRCPFCQALIGASWSRWHGPHCPSRTRPDIDEALDRIAEQLDRWADACRVPSTYEESA